MSRNTFEYAGPDGERLISVTEVLKLAGLVDLSGIPEATLERARERGVDVHSWVEGMALGLIDDESPPENIAGYVAGYRRFLAETGFAATSAERTVIHPTYRYAGRIDLLGTIKGNAWLFDLKATAAIPAESKLQTAGYRMAYVNDPNSGQPASPRRAVLHLRPDGTYVNDEHKDHRNDEHDFLAALRVASWKLRHGRAHLED